MLPSCRYFTEKGGGRNNKGVCNRYIDDTNYTPTPIKRGINDHRSLLKYTQKFNSGKN